MIFSSVIFIYCFLPITLAGYYIINPKFRNYWLLLVSLIFFGWSQPHYLWIIILNIAINYISALLIDRRQRYRKPLLVIAVVLNLAILFYFKYFDFMIETVNQIAGSAISLRNIVLPIGVPARMIRRL